MRWSSKSSDCKSLLTLFDKHFINPNYGVDPSNITAKYIKKVFEDNKDFLHKYKLKNFYAVYRNLSRKYLIEKENKKKEKVSKKFEIFNGLIILLLTFLCSRRQTTS